VGRALRVGLRSLCME